MIVMHVAESIQGGVATVLGSLCHVGEPDGTNVHHIVVIPGSQAASLDVDGLSNVTVVPFKGKGRLARSIFLLFWINFLLLRYRPCVLHLHSTFAGVIVRIFAFPYVVGKIIYQPHGVSFDPDRVGRSWLYRIYRIVEWFLAFRTDVVVAISMYESLLLKDIVRPGCLRLIENGVRASSVDLNRKRSGFLFVGRLDRQKGFDLVSSCWSDIANGQELQVAGASVLLEKNAGAGKWGNEIKMLGWVASQNLDALYAGACAVIVPSRWEGFGLVVAEAFRNSTPVICSDRGALPYSVTDGLNGVVFSLDKVEQSLAAALSRFNAADWGSLSKQAYSTYQERWKERHMIASFSRLYGEIKAS